MPDDVQTMFSVREVPWHRKGKVLETNPKSIQEALHLCGTDWLVEVRPIYVPAVPNPLVVDQMTMSPNHRAVVRIDNGAILGIVGNRFVPVQNVEAFQFLDNLLGTAMLFKTAGALGQGERVWVLSQIPDHIIVAGNAVEQYVLFSNSHDGKSSVTVMQTPIVVVCRNTLNLAISRAKNKFTFRHVGNTSEKLYQARQVLGMTVDYMKQFKKVGDKLALIPYSDDKLAETVEKMYGPAETDRAVTNLEAVKNSVLNIAHGKTAGNAEGTKWGAINAFCEYLDYYRPTRGDSDLFARINFEPTNPKQKVFDLIANN